MNYYNWFGGATLSIISIPGKCVGCLLVDVEFKIMVQHEGKIGLH